MEPLEMLEPQVQRFKFPSSMFFITRKNGHVVSFSPDRPDSVSKMHELVEIEVNEQQLEEIRNAKQIFFKEGVLEIFPFEPDDKLEIRSLLEKLKHGKMTKDDRDRAILLLLQKTQI